MPYDGRGFESYWVLSLALFPISDQKSVLEEVNHYFLCENLPMSSFYFKEHLEKLNSKLKFVKYFIFVSKNGQNNF